MFPPGIFPVEMRTFMFQSQHTDTQAMSYLLIIKHSTIFIDMRALEYHTHYGNSIGFSIRSNSSDPSHSLLSF